MEIKPKIGFDNIKYGMYRKDIIEILGKPNRVITDEDDKFEERLEWNELKIRLTFQLDKNDKFTYLTSKNENMKFRGKQIIGMDINDAKNILFSDLITEWEIDNYQFFETHFNENFWLTLHSEFGKVLEFEMGVPFKNENEYNWPK